MRNVKIFEPRYHRISNKPKCNAREYAESYLDGSDCERGSVETAQAQADNASEMLAKLIHMLFEKDLLTVAEVKKIVTGYFDDDQFSDQDEDEFK